MKKWFDIRPYGLALLLLTASPLTALYAQQPGQSLFTDASDIDYKSLDALQQQNYDILAANPNVAYIKLVRYDLLSKVQDNGIVSINLPFLPCPKMQYRAKQVNFTSDDDYEWYGEIISNNDTTCSDGFLTMVNMTDSGGLMGTLVMNNFRAEIQDLSGGVKAFVVMDQNKLDEGRCGNEVLKESTPLGGDPVVVGGPYEGPNGSNNPVVIGGEDCVKKDLKVLVLYTPGAKAVLPNNAGGPGPHGATIGLDAMLSIFSANTVLSNSNIPYQVSLAGVAELPGYQEIADKDREVKQIATYPPAQQLRDQYHADVVMLMVKPGIFGNNIWGNTREIGSFNTTTGLFDPAYAFSVVDIKWSIWTRTFAHELGHVLGARHDVRNDPRTNVPFLDNNAHAYKFEKWYGPFLKFYRTTMTYYNWGFRNYIPYYSNPDVTYSGKATGTTDQNNARRVKEHFPAIASIYTEPTGFTNYFDVQFMPYPPSPKGLQRICNNYAKLTATTNGCTLLKNYAHSWQICTDGINWIDAGTSTTLTVEPTNSTIFVKLTTRTTSPFISTAVYQHTLLFDCPTVLAPLKSTTQNETVMLNATTIYPNPNNGSFTMRYNAEREQKAVITLLDISGKKLEVLYNGTLRKGSHEIQLRAQQKYKAGIYILKAQGASLNQQIKITIQ